MKDSMRPIEILLVDDNPGDIRLTRESFKDSRIANTIHAVTDGQQAIEYLNGLLHDAERDLPDLILLDLDMPVMDGREVLEVLKNSDDFKGIPIIVLTISPSDKDVVDAYGLHANSYIKKPVDLDDFLSVLKAFEGFWLTVVKLPRR